MARLAPDRLDATTAVTAILIAVAANSISKVVLASVTAGRDFAKLLAPVLAATLLAGAAGLWIPHQPPVSFGWHWPYGLRYMPAGQALFLFFLATVALSLLLWRAFDR